VNRIWLVRTTFGGRAHAEQVACALIEERLAACATLEAVHSIYRWQGEIEQADEVAVLFKTRVGSVSALATRIEELHDYDLPVIERWPARANVRARDWVYDVTA
jgi:periplasmic divalent cation tolerance protein